MKPQKIYNPYTPFSPNHKIEVAIQSAHERARRFTDNFLVVRLSKGLAILTETELGLRRHESHEVVYSTKNGYYMSA